VVVAGDNFKEENTQKKKQQDMHSYEET